MNLDTRTLKTVEKQVKEKFDISNDFLVPKIVKVVINAGVGKATIDSKIISEYQKKITLIAGQKAVQTKAKKSVATFKLREGMPIGCKVTLRKSKAYDFLQRLVLVALPRTRDFKGFSVKSFDPNANISFGFPDITVFPEIADLSDTDKIGLDVTIVTSTTDKKVCKFYLEQLNLPFID